MRQKLEQLVIELIKIDDWISSSSLSRRINHSQRAIKSYVRDINTLHPDTIFSSQKGYRVNVQESTQFLEILKTSLPDYNRTNALILNLLNQKDKQNLYDLAESFFISVSTLKQDIKKIQKYLFPYDILIKIKGDSIILLGLETNKRKVVSNLLYEESHMRFIDYTTIQHNFPNINIQRISSILSSTLTDNNLFVNDISQISLTLHVAITIDRILNHHLIQSTVNQPISDPNITNISRQILSAIGKDYQIVFNNNEVNDFSLLLLSRSTSAHFEAIKLSDLTHYVSHQTICLVSNIIDFLNDFYLFDVNDQQFVIPFSLHIHNLLLRSSCDKPSRNPLIESIRISHPLLYEIAVNISTIITAETNIILNNDEIGYICLHIGGALENTQRVQHKLSTVLICPEYYSMKSSIHTLIEDTFENQIYIDNIVHSQITPDILNKYDLIISTIPLQLHLPHLVISPLFNEHDKRKLQSLIYRKQEQNKRLKLKPSFMKLSNHRFFYKDESITNKHEVISFLCNHLVKENIVDCQFEQDILKREALSSTAFGFIAIPHTIKMRAHLSTLAIFVSEKGILWDNSKINCVFLMAMNEKDRDDFYQTFELLSSVFSQHSLIKHAEKANSYETFVASIFETEISES